MRIAYILAEDLSKHSGLKHKIDTQIQYWQSAGHEVFRIHHFEGVIIHPSGSRQVLSRNYSSMGVFSKWQRLRRLSLQYDFVRKVLEEIKPDLTYSRYLFPAKNLDRIKEYAGRLVMEINSDDRAEYFQKSCLTGLYNALFRQKVLSQADGLVFVTNELARKSVFASFTELRSVIGNGVEVGAFEFARKVASSPPQLVFIGSPDQSWHGLDKIGVLAEQLPKFDIHIIGPDRLACMRLWKRMPANVVLHGYLPNAEAQQVIKIMDVGISTLALHRKNMSEACPLKVRQYLAQGIPVITASADPDIHEEQPFYLQLPNTENNVSSNIIEIRDFVERVKGKEDIRISARQYAESYFSAAKKEAKRLQFFEQVLSS